MFLFVVDVLTSSLARAVSKMVIRGPAPPTTGCELRSPIRPALAAAGLLVFLLIAQPLPALVTRAPPAEKETPKIVEDGETALQAAEQRAASAWEMLANRGVSQMVPEIAATREKVQWRKFMAGSYNQDRYGNRPQTNVTISVADMHLDALRKVNSEIAAIDAEDKQREANAIDVEYEELTSDGR